MMLSINSFKNILVHVPFSDWDGYQLLSQQDKSAALKSGLAFQGQLQPNKASEGSS